VLLTIVSSDYAENELLDTYSNAGLNDEEVFESMSVAARRAAEAKMRQRDRLERGGQRGMRAANQSHVPTYFDRNDAGADNDDESGLLSGTHTSTSEGMSTIWKGSRMSVYPQPSRGACFLISWSRKCPWSSCIKAESIVEWIANDRGGRSIVNTSASS